MGLRGHALNWKERSEANLLPLSIEQRHLYLALSEWLYRGEMYDLGEPCELCGLCEHPDLRYQFKIVNSYNGNELLVGSECITKSVFKKLVSGASHWVRLGYGTPSTVPN
jgi:hypothetical protein